MYVYVVLWIMSVHNIKCIILWICVWAEHSMIHWPKEWYQTEVLDRTSKKSIGVFCNEWMSATNLLTCQPTEIPWSSGWVWKNTLFGICERENWGTDVRIKWTWELLVRNWEQLKQFHRRMRKLSNVWYVINTWGRVTGLRISKIRVRFGSGGWTNCFRAHPLVAILVESLGSLAETVQFKTKIQP